MFIAYTDASVKDKQTTLAFLIVFEDKSIIKKRILVNESNNHIAEALAVKELISFLHFYNLKNGLLLFDSNAVKNSLTKKGGKLNRYITDDTKLKLGSLEIQTQVIHRKLNIAHKICYEDKFFKSNVISEINRSIYSEVPDFPQYFLQPSVLEEYRTIYNKRFANFHETQMKLNKKIWLADLVEDKGDIRIYEFYDRRIKVFGNTIVKLTHVDYVRISNHLRVIRRGKKLKKLLRRYNPCKTRRLSKL